MSDLLLMANSPLRYLLSTPGTVALYDPGRQIATGTTGQVLTDYSGRGNHAQLGSTSGVDANDPAWGSNVLTFGGDDYVGTPSLGTGDITVFTVCYVPAQAADWNGLWARNNVMVTRYKADRGFSLLFRSGSANKSGGSVVVPNDTWAIITARLTSGGIGALSFTGVGTLAPSGFELNTTASTYGQYIGRQSNDYWENAIACHVVFNRVLPDAEATRVRRNIITLMAQQGISL